MDAVSETCGACPADPSLLRHLRIAATWLGRTARTPNTKRYYICPGIRGSDDSEAESWVCTLDAVASVDRCSRAGSNRVCTTLKGIRGVKNNKSRVNDDVGDIRDIEACVTGP